MRRRYAMKSGTISLTIFFLLLPLLSFSEPTKNVGTSKSVPSPILAMVNGTPITTQDFKLEFSNLPAHLRDIAISPEGRKEMLDTMVLREMILQEASREGIDKQQQIADKLKELRNRLIVETYLSKKLETEISISEKELKTYYEQNKVNFMIGEQIRASQVLLDTEEGAKSILASLQAGASFEDLARKNSVDDSSAPAGGDLGWFGRGSMDQTFEDAAFALKAGQTSEIIKTEYGYHIIKITGNRKDVPLPFDEVKDQIREVLVPAKKQEKFLDIKASLKKNSQHTINEKALDALELP